MWPEPSWHLTTSEAQQGTHLPEALFPVCSGITRCHTPSPRARSPSPLPACGMSSGAEAPSERQALTKCPRSSAPSGGQASGSQGRAGVVLSQTPPTASSSGFCTFNWVSPLSLQGRFGPSLVQGLLALSLAANALFTSAYLYQILR